MSLWIWTPTSNRFISLHICTFSMRSDYEVILFLTNAVTCVCENLNPASTCGLLYVTIWKILHANATCRNASLVGVSLHSVFLLSFWLLKKKQLGFERNMCSLFAWADLRGSGTNMKSNTNTWKVSEATMLPAVLLCCSCLLQFISGLWTILWI